MRKDPPLPPSQASPLPFMGLVTSTDPVRDGVLDCPMPDGQARHLQEADCRWPNLAVHVSSRLPSQSPASGSSLEHSRQQGVSVRGEVEFLLFLKKNIYLLGCTGS